MSNSQEQKSNRKPSSLTGIQPGLDPGDVILERGTAQNNVKSPSVESVSPSIISPSIDPFHSIVRAQNGDDTINNKDNMSNETTTVSNERERNERNKSESGSNQSPLIPTSEKITPGLNKSHKHQTEDNTADSPNTFEMAPETVTSNDTEATLVSETTDAGTNPQKLSRTQKRRQQRKKWKKEQEENVVDLKSNCSGDSSQNQQNGAVSETTGTLAQPTRRRGRRRHQDPDSSETDTEMAVESSLDRQQNNDVTQTQIETSRTRDPERSVSVMKLSKNQRRKRNKQKRQQDKEDAVVTNEALNNTDVTVEDNGVLPTSAANVAENSEIKDVITGNAVSPRNKENGLPSTSQSCVPQETPVTSISTREVLDQDKDLGTRDVVPYDKAFADRQTLIHRSVCLFCKSEGFNKLNCRHCEMARYCNKDCRRQDKANHRRQCKLVAKFFKAKAKIPSSLLEQLRDQANFMGVSFFIGSLPDVTRFNILGGSKIGVLVEIDSIIPDENIWIARVKDASNHTIDVRIFPFTTAPILGGTGVFLENLELAKKLKPGRFMLLLKSRLLVYETKSAVIEIHNYPGQVRFIDIDT